MYNLSVTNKLLLQAESEVGKDKVEEVWDEDTGLLFFSSLLISSLELSDTTICEP